MEKKDHYKTGSWGNSKEAKQFRKDQKELIDKGDPEGAQKMGVDDVRDKFGSKYDESIKQRGIL